MLHKFYCFAVLAAMIALPTNADPLTIVSWNASPESAETFERRVADIRDLNTDLAPDILIVLETTGKDGIQWITEALEWDSYYAIVSDFASHPTNAFFALETAVISKVPIESVIEYDASPDGTAPIISSENGFNVPIAEIALSSSGISGFSETVAQSDRGTLRVDLKGGLTIFPIHLKSNRNGACGNLRNAGRALKAAGIEVPASVGAALSGGFLVATREHVRNAQKRERVMAATIHVAEDAINEGRSVMIAGDYNTAFEPGKAGRKLDEDCRLLEFSCDKAPFPASACTGDGFDDTLAMLEDGLVGSSRWTILTADLPRTFDDPAFADLAIDHMAVPTEVSDRFVKATRAGKTYGSDHFPIISIFSE